MNPRLQKVITDIEKTKARITEQQARLRELEAQRIDMENTEIISLFRSVDAAPHELADFIKAYKAETASAANVQTQPSQPAYSYQAAQEDLEHEE